MMLSEFYKQLRAAGDVHAFSAYLAAPDRDGVDVDLVPVGRVEVDYEKAEARLYPASTATDVDSVEPEPYFGMILDQLPINVVGENDLRLLVELPLLRNGEGGEQVRLEEIVAIHVGKSSEEVWLLVRPAGDFAAGLLPA
ncbi:MAG TPA: hypothetical protein VMC02_11900 [Steroidobacteraceae bacterium]|nr:hypothetical protein [Steroidobacteraceae bacterium]